MPSWSGSTLCLVFLALSIIGKALFSQFDSSLIGYLLSDFAGFISVSQILDGIFYDSIIPAF